MLNAWIYTFVGIITVSLVSLVGGLTLVLSGRLQRKIIFFLVSLSVGALFGDVFIHILPEAFESTSTGKISFLILVGIMIFFVLEKFLHWRHDHIDHCEDCHTYDIKPIGYMALASDTIHNFIDGLVIGASFLVGVDIGIATTIAVILHEVPQELGNFALLLQSGFSKWRALWLNFLSALSAILGGVVALVVTSQSSNFVTYILPITAGGFIYIAGSDLVPELHKTKELKKSIIQLAAIFVGFGMMLALLYIE